MRKSNRVEQLASDWQEMTIRHATEQQTLLARMTALLASEDLTGVEKKQLDMVVDCMQQTEPQEEGK